MEISIQRITDMLMESVETKRRLYAEHAQLERLLQMGLSMIALYSNGGKLLIAGNGGSAADAQHFAAEITCQFIVQRKARPAIALHTDTSALTAWGNDYSYETAYKRLVEAYGSKEDGLVLISTSGNSKNLIEAAKQARQQGMRVFGLLGKDGGELLKQKLCDEYIVVPSQETPRIQETHVLLIHILCDILDTQFMKEDLQLAHA